MIRYNSKSCYEMVLIIALKIGIISGIFIFNQIWAGLIIILVVIIFVGYFFMTTFYLINDNNLIIKSGFLINTTIKINSIKRIVETKNILSAPAASIDRIAIYYNKNDAIMISPKNRIDFINKLTSVNSKIEVNLRNK